MAHAKKPFPTLAACYKGWQRTRKITAVESTEGKLCYGCELRNTSNCKGPALYVKKPEGDVPSYEELAEMHNQLLEDHSALQEEIAKLRKGE